MSLYWGRCRRGLSAVPFVRVNSPIRPKCSQAVQVLGSIPIMFLYRLLTNELIVEQTAYTAGRPVVTNRMPTIR